MHKHTCLEIIDFDYESVNEIVAKEKQKNLDIISH